MIDLTLSLKSRNGVGEHAVALQDKALCRGLNELIAWN